MNPPPLLPVFLNKVPEISLSFWLIKILSTTVGETGADFLAVNVGWGAGLTLGLMGGLLAVALILQAQEQLGWRTEIPLTFQAGVTTLGPVAVGPAPKPF